MFLKDLNNFNSDLLDGKHASNTANNVPVLDSSAKLPIAQIPTGTTSSTVSLGNHTHSNVATANTLATARTINGTSFNGSANITTANWGTARNISIADSDGTNTGSAVSVNGSGNATLKLPATIKASLSGNASTSTKATQDSAGQQINTTYIKGLSVSGKTITYTKGDGSTGTITTQDTNTTYSTGTASALGLTKLYTGTGTATDGTMTQNAIKVALDGKANSSHGRHIPDACATITDWNSATTNGWYMGNNATNAPTANAWYFGEVVAHNTNYVIQTVYQFTASSDAKAIPKYIRAKMNGTWGAWTNVTVAKAVPSNAVFTDTNTWRGVQDNLTSTATDQSLSANQGKVLKGLVDGKANSSHTHSYLPLSGGTLTGNVTISTDSKLEWNRNTDYARISFKNTSDDDSDSYMHFLTGDNGNEYFKFSSLSGSATTDLLTIKTDHLRYKGNAVYHAGNPQTSVSGNAGTATKLQTARTINGTSFNGSGNITTANWGTARTLTIGNSGKSVNGSGNVSWSLSEIGAVSTSSVGSLSNLKTTAKDNLVNAINEVASNSGGAGGNLPTFKSVTISNVTASGSYDLTYVLEGGDDIVYAHRFTVDGENHDFIPFKDGNTYTYHGNGLTPGKTCVCRVYISNGTSTQSSELFNVVVPQADIYGFACNEKDSNPDTAVTYIEGAVGLARATLEDLGDWEHRFPFNQIRPCGFKNGKVYKYIQKNDFTKYEDGTAVGDDVDVMIEIPKVYWKATKTTDGGEIRISPIKRDGYECYAHNLNGVEKEFIYIGAYAGDSSAESKRSISKTKVAITDTIFSTLRNSKGERYILYTYHMNTLMQILFVLLFKTFNSRNILGITATGANGVLDTMGLIANNGKSCKFLGIQDPFAEVYLAGATYLIYTTSSSTEVTNLVTLNINNTNIGFSVSYSGGEEVVETAYKMGLSYNSSGHRFINKLSWSNVAPFAPIGTYGGGLSTYYCSKVYKQASQTTDTSSGGTYVGSANFETFTGLRFGVPTDRNGAGFSIYKVYPRLAYI